MRYRLENVHYMPKSLEPGVLYYTSEYRTCAHLCPCGCGSKIRTPISPVEWAIEDGRKGPSLWPSVGNWQLPCRSHYWIQNGSVKWAEDWSEDEIQYGRSKEQMRREDFYHKDQLRNNGVFTKIWQWLKSIFS